ncbi:transmembrane 6 superfamily member 1-like isoform X2 [Antennarius striatus]|uniref:transmembrane 6 superfamily member 1-like isoform X2 n=1 Tax=Antennarius striatus TaxID=241820 RepID=UPI0035AF3854
MTASAGTGVFVFSLMSIPICYFFNSLIYNNSAEAFLFAGCTTVLILAMSVNFMIKKKMPVDPLFYVYAVHAFLSVVNLIIGLEQDNIIDGFVTFYLRVGQLQSHWTLLGGIFPHAWHSLHSWKCWKFGTHTGPLFLLHIPYICLSVWACFRIFSQPCTWDVQFTAQNQGNHEAERKSLLHRPLDLLFAIYLIPAFAFCVFRGLIVLDCSCKWYQDYAQHYEPYLKDPSAYPKIQMLVNMLYSGPYYIIALYGLMVPGCQWMPDLTLVHSGALAQAQFSHIGASLHTRTPFSYRVPADSQSVFLLVNVLYTVVPQALCYRCHTQPAFFLRPVPDKKTE